MARRSGAPATEALARARIGELQKKNPKLVEAEPARPVARAAAPATRRRLRARATVQVQAGDSLWAISQRLGVKLQELCDWNGIKNPKRHKLQVGRELVVRPPPVPSGRPGQRRGLIHAPDLNFPFRIVYLDDPHLGPSDGEGPSVNTRKGPAVQSGSTPSTKGSTHMKRIVAALFVLAFATTASADAAATYAAKCKMCHGAAGEGSARWPRPRSRAWPPRQGPEGHQRGRRQDEAGQDRRRRRRGQVRRRPEVVRQPGPRRVAGRRASRPVVVSGPSGDGAGRIDPRGQRRRGERAEERRRGRDPHAQREDPGREEEEGRRPEREVGEEAERRRVRPRAPPARRSPRPTTPPASPTSAGLGEDQRPDVAGGRAQRLQDGDVAGPRPGRSPRATGRWPAPRAPS